MRTHSKYYWLLIAGLAGGLIEVIWISLYSLTVSTQVTEIGSAIATTIYSPSTEFYLAPVLGLAIHMILSVILAFIFGSIIWPVIERIFHHSTVAMIASITMLAIVWKVNFYLILPIWNPEFIALLPLTVTLASKVLFGLAMGTVLTIYRQKYPISI